MQKKDFNAWLGLKPLHSVAYLKQMLETKVKNRKERKKFALEDASIIVREDFGTVDLASTALMATPGVRQRWPLPLKLLPPQDETIVEQGTARSGRKQECVPPQGVSGLNSLHSIKCMRAPLVSQLAFLWPKQLCICKWLSLLPTQFWCSPFSPAQCLL